jgi:SAM-dependent methyltransferase
MPRLLSTDRVQALSEIFQIKVEGSGPRAWSPQLRQRFGYFTPDECYEAILYRLVDKDTEWLDVGCGRDLFPSNRKLAHILSSRCRLLVGVDPDDNIRDNLDLHEKAQCRIEGYSTDRRFDVITLRMVAEHISDPETTLSALRRLTRIGGRVIIYTVGRYSSVTMMAAITPISIHRWARALLWNSALEDAFPTVFRMNTRKTLASLFSRHEFAEEEFLYLNDCNTFCSWKWSAVIELWAERACRRLGLRYPEFCLLGVYRNEGIA